MRWPWPRSIAAQLVAVILLALALALGATLLIFTDERREALELLRRTQVISRVVSTVELLAALPPEQQLRLVRHASTPQLRITIDPEAAVGADDDSGHGRLQSRLSHRLGGLVREIRVRRPSAPMLWRPWHDDEDGRENWQARLADWRARAAAAPPRPPHPPLDGFAIAIRLLDGRWLNARGVAPPPGPWPAGSAIIVMLLMSAAVIGGVVMVVRRLTSPLRQLAVAADRLGRGESMPPLPDVGPEEVRRTTRAFNRMQERLRRFVDDRTRMLAAISHDLRTPITTLRLRAEFIDDDETRTKILETLEELQRMAEATLAFVREEASSEETRIVDLAALVESVVDDLSDLGRDAVMTSAARTPYACRPVALKRAARNLIENAVAYGSRARVRLSREGDELRLTVDDDGPGIPDADVERVFAPFVRLEPSRNAETGGIGLGLAIARTIARAHGGDVTLTNRPEGGLTALLRLPVQDRD